ncbi:MAG: hypothetical protein ACK4GG_02885 [Sphingomonas sp.]
MADAAGVSDKRFRHHLRLENFSWHRHSERWLVTEGSEEHQAMLKVLARLR